MHLTFSKQYSYKNSPGKIAGVCRAVLLAGMFFTAGLVSANVVNSPELAVEKKNYDSLLTEFDNGTKSVGIDLSDLTSSILSVQTIKTVGNRVDAPSSDYATLSEAFTAINTGNITGAIVLQVVANITETSSASLSESGTGSSSYTSVLIYPTVAATISIVTGDLIVLNGADNVTIDGRINGPSASDSTRSLILESTHSQTFRNDGTLVFVNGATGNAVKYCILKGSVTNNPNFGGVINFKTSSGTTGNNSNTIHNNYITSFQSTAGARVGVNCNGTSGLENSNNTISNNEFADLWSSTLTSTSLYVRSGANNWTISGNSFYQTADLALQVAVNSSFPLTNISIGTGAGHLVEGNYIGGSSAQAAGSLKVNSTVAAINLTCIVVSSASVSIQGNFIRGFDLRDSSIAAAQLWAINCFEGGTVDIGTITGNTIGGDLEVAKLKAKTRGGNPLDVAGIVIAGSSTVTSTYNIRNNTIKGLVSDQFTSTGYYNVAGIRIGRAQNFLNAATMIGISNNSIGNLNALSASTGSSQTVSGIINFSSATVTVDENIIYGLSNASTNIDSGASGIRHSPVSTEAPINIKNNLIVDTDLNSLNYYGIFLTRTGYSITNNIISLTGGTATSVWGIWDNVGSSQGSSAILNNTVYIGGTVNSGTKNSWAIRSNSSNVTRKTSGNILINARSNSGTANGKHYAIRQDNAVVPAVINFNDYYVSGIGGVLGIINGVEKTTLADWQAATGQDCNSYNENPGFSSPGGTSASNYLPSNVVLMSNATDSELTDFFGTTRSSTKPAMGAIEYAITPGSSSLFLSSFTPASGPVGSVVTITGSGFTGATAVDFNGTPATTYTVNSSTEISAIVPTGATTGKITVTVPCGSNSNTTISSIDFVRVAAPEAPTNLNPTACGSQVSISFTPGAAGDIDSPITNYEYTLDGTNWTTFSPAVTGTTVTITVMTSGTYNISLRAVSIVVAGASSTSVTVTIANSVTVTYTGVTIINPTNKSASITLSASVTLPSGADASQSQFRFINRDTGQPISGWLTITAGSPSNTGTASYGPHILTLGASEIFKKYGIGFEVGNTGCYSRNNSADDVFITLAEPSCGCY